jgi:dCMP deaminase
MKSKLTKWDKRFMEQASFVASWSKDKNTKTGAVVVNSENTILSTGYNGFPRGVDDDTDQRRYEKPDKYFWTEHSERNCLYNAAREGISLKGGKMYCTYFPCVDCARGIIQVGIIKIYTEKPDLNHATWGDSWINAIIMLKECGVEIIWTNE